MNHYVLIDGNNLAFQSQAAGMGLKNRTQRLYAGDKETTAINGVLQALRAIQLKWPEAKLLVLWDTGKNWRYGIYPDYKGNRKVNPDLVAIKEALEPQLQEIPSICDCMGIPQVSAEGYEADDIAAFMADLLQKGGHKVTLVTRDRDWLQMVGPNVSWHDRWDDRTVSHLTFEAEIGAPSPHEFSEMKILMGDRGDNVFGIKGCGEVTADHLVRTFGTVEAFFDKWEEWVADGGLTENKSLNRAQKALTAAVQCPDTRKRIVEQNRRLMDLRTMFGNKELAKAIRKTPGRVNPDSLKSQLARLAFVKIITDMGQWLAPFVKA